MATTTHRKGTMQTVGPRYTLEQIEEMPTIHQGQYANLKIDTSTERVWLSRLTVEDGQPYNNQVTVEHLADGSWVTVAEYEPDPSL